MSKFEKKFGKYAIPNLTNILIACYALGYLLWYLFPQAITYLSLDPYAILHGQVWRLVTWIIMPPGGNIFTVLISLYFYWSIGTTLERTWGTYRYNVYILSGLLFTVIGSFLLMGYVYLTQGQILAVEGVAAPLFRSLSLYFSTYYVNMSIFLAFAVTFPNVQVLLMFLIPIKVKWLGIIYGVVLVWDFLTVNSVGMRFAEAASLLNFVIFFLNSRKWFRTPKQAKRQYEFKREVHRGTNTISVHKCAICGRTNDSNPELEFRFCSKCNGNYEYCQDHLFTHKHVE